MTIDKCTAVDVIQTANTTKRMREYGVYRSGAEDLCLQLCNDLDYLHWIALRNYVPFSEAMLLYWTLVCPVATNGYRLEVEIDPELVGKTE